VGRGREQDDAARMADRQRRLDVPRVEDALGPEEGRRVQLDEVLEEDVDRQEAVRSGRSASVWKAPKSTTGRVVPVRSTSP